jgi:hypothetical protein
MDAPLVRKEPDARRVGQRPGVALHQQVGIAIGEAPVARQLGRDVAAQPAARDRPDVATREDRAQTKAPPSSTTSASNAIVTRFTMRARAGRYESSRLRRDAEILLALVDANGAAFVDRIGDRESHARIGEQVLDPALGRRVTRHHVQLPIGGDAEDRHRVTEPAATRLDRDQRMRIGEGPVGRRRLRVARKGPARNRALRTPGSTRRERGREEQRRSGTHAATSSRVGCARVIACAAPCRRISGTTPASTSRRCSA